MSEILETTKFVFDNSKYVKINPSKIAEFARSYQQGKFSHWLSDSPFDFSNFNIKDKLNFLLAFGSINFCYWGEPKWTIEYHAKNYDGAWGMVAVMKRALENGKPILEAEYRSEISKEDFSEIFAGNVEIPLLEERWKITREVASQLLDKYNGDFSKMVDGAKGDAMNLLKLIIETFSSFDDKSIFKNKQVYFYKRAQLLVSDACHSLGIENFTNIDQLTAFADYKVPQVLRALGITSYEKNLAEKVDNKILIPKDSQEEIEIRSNAIWAVEFIRQELEKIGKPQMAIEIDGHFWLAGQDKTKHKKPYHRTLTTAY